MPDVPDDVPGDDIVEDVQMRAAAGDIGPPRRRGIARASSWGILAQVTPLVVNIALTPYVLAGFEDKRYGLFLLVAGLTFFLSSSDGGITLTAQRYFSIFAGRGDKHETTRLLCTATALTATLAAVLAGAMWALAPRLVGVLHGVPVELRDEAVFMLRGGAIIYAIVVLRGIPIGILQAYNRFALTSVTNALTYIIYVVGLVLTIENGWGLRGAIITMIVQQSVSTLVLLPSTVQYLTRSGVRLYSWRETIDFLRFSVKMQMLGWSNLFMAEVDALVIAAVLPVENVTYYGNGSGFVVQVRNVPANAIAPIQTALSHSFAQDGTAAFYREFERLQKLWVVGVAGWCAAAIGASYFGVTAWLGNAKNDYHTSGIVAAILMVGAFCFLGQRVLATALNVVGEPGHQARMSGVLVAVNVSLTVALVWFGIFGIVAATVAAQIAGVIYLDRTVRRRHAVPMRSFLRDVPILACLATIACVFVTELLIRPFVPRGPIGLLMCAAAAVPGVLLYARLALSADIRARLIDQIKSRLRR